MEEVQETMTNARVRSGVRQANYCLPASKVAYVVQALIAATERCLQGSQVLFDGAAISDILANISLPQEADLQCTRFCG